MTVLYEMTEYGYGGFGALGSICFVLIFVFGAVAAGAFISDGVKSILAWISCIATVAATVFCIFFFACFSRPLYKVYLSDMPFNEFAEDYEVTDADGLIITAYKKGEK